MNIAGSDVSASDVVLAAANQINLTNTTDTFGSASTNSSSGYSFGGSYGTSGWGGQASVSNSHGDANDTETTVNNTHVTGTNSVSIVSGGDTNIIGSNVNGGTVSAAVGGNLDVESVQDTASSAAHQSSSGFSVSGSQRSASVSVTAQNGHADSSYAQVNEQAGIQAGSGGFDIAVGGNTNLKGAVISSAADASKNSLATGTLTFSNVDNSSHYSVASNGFSAGFGTSSTPGGSTGKAVGPGSVSGAGGLSPMISQDENGDDSATTRSAISAGTINITDQALQTQDVSTLSRDTTNTNGNVAKTPDVNAMLSDQADLMQAAQAAGQVVAQGIGTYADMKEKEAADAVTAAANNQDIAAGDAASADFDNWKEGGDYRTALHIVGGALVGGLGGGALDAFGGAAGAGLTSSLAKELQSIGDGVSDTTGSSLIGRLAENVVASIAGAAVGGTAGAATGTAVNLYNQDRNDEEKELEREVGTARQILGALKVAASLGGGAVAEEEIAIPKIAGNPALAGLSAAENTAGATGVPSALQQVQSLFSTNTPGVIQIDGVTFNELPNSGKAAIFSGVTETQVTEYFLDLTGASALPNPVPLTINGVQGVRYTVNTPLGNFTLRNVSQSAGQTGAS